MNNIFQLFISEKASINAGSELLSEKSRVGKSPIQKLFDFSAFFTSPVRNSKLNSNPIFSGFIYVLILAGSVFYSGCKTNKITKDQEPKQYVVYPAPPDTARLQYLTKITTSLDIKKKESGFKKMLIGTEKPKTIVKPYGIAIHKGKIYVCDTYGGGMEIIDLEKRTFDFFRPSGKGLLRNPINCFVDEDGFLYVADMGRYQVVVFDQNGNYVKYFGESEKFKPNDVCVKGNKIFVANLANQKICVYSKDSINKLLYSFPNVEAGQPGALYSPTNIAISNDKIYVSDFGDYRVKYYTLKGEIIDSIGSIGTYPGQFSKIKGVAVDRKGIVYAVDVAFENVQIFDEKNHFLMSIGDHYNGPGGMILPAKVIIDYDNLKYFQQYVDPSLDLKYLVIVTNQYGPDLINIYGRVEPKKVTPK